MYMRGKVNYPSTSLTSGTTYYIFCGAAPANQRIAIEGVAFFGAANAAQTPGILEFCNATTQGSTGTTLTPQPTDQNITETFQSSWIANPGTLPSSPTAIDTRLVNPQIGLTDYFPGQLAYVIKGGGFMVVRFTPAWTGNYAGWIYIAE